MVKKERIGASSLSTDKDYVFRKGSHVKTFKFLDSAFYYQESRYNLRRIDFDETHNLENWFYLLLFYEDFEKVLKREIRKAKRIKSLFEDLYEEYERKTSIYLAQELL